MFRPDFSDECTSSLFEYWSSPPTDISIQSSMYHASHPISPLVHGAPIQFIIKRSDQFYLDLSSTFLSLQVEIQNENGTPITAVVKDQQGAYVSGDRVAPVCGLLQSLFSQVEVVLGETQITDNIPINPYISYLQNLFCYSEDASKSWLRSALFKIDESGKFADTDPSLAKSNSSLKWRGKSFGPGKIVPIMGKIHSDILTIDKPLLNNIDLKIKLIRSKDFFPLISVDDKNYRVFIHSAQVFVRRILPAPPMILAHERQLRQSNAKYHFIQNNIQFIHIPIGVQSFQRDQINFSADLPKFIMLGLITDAQLNKTNHQVNPFEFNFHNLTECRVTKDNTDCHLSPIKISENNTMNAYQTLFVSSAEGIFSNDSVRISPEDYANGFALMLFNLEPNPCNEHLAPISKANISVSLTFDKPISGALNLMIFSAKDAFLQIDSSRRCFIET